MAVIDAYPSPVKDCDDNLEWEALIGLIQNSGVDLANSLGALTPSLDGANRRITTGPGAALIGGLYRATTTAEATSVPTASASNRVDRLVWRYNRAETTTASAVIFPKVITGTPGSATPPDIVRTPDGFFDIRIARWTSLSTGALSGLVSEHDYLHNRGSIPCYSTNRPPNTPGVQIFEIDTGMARLGDGANWRVLSEDATSAVAATGYWKTSFDNVVSRLNGWVELRLALERTTNTLHFGDDGSPLVGALPAGYRPRRVSYDMAYISGGRFGQVIVGLDGSVNLTGLSGDIPVGATMRATVVYQGI